MVKAKLRSWGNSFGIVVPKNVVDEQRLKEGDEVLIEVKPTMTLKDMFGSFKDWKLDAQKFKDERRKEDKKRDEVLSGLIRDNRDN